MNYRHAFHAGNFADVLKHAVLALVLRHLAQKDAAFRVIDTHAGIGRYDLGGDKAGRTGERRDGVGRLDQPLSDPAEVVLAPWRAVLSEVRALHGERAYPGSPAIAQAMSRAQDRLVFVEKHPEDVVSLQEAIGRDRRVRVVELDGWTALKAYVPPPERRGLVLVDPPFEEPNEFQRMGDAVLRAWTKWRTGTFMLWYPVKDPRVSDAFGRDLAAAGIDKVLRIELDRCAAAPDGRLLSGTGLVLINPPWTLPADMEALLPSLSARLASGKGAGWRCEWLSSSN